jgi:hypothetical protein
VVHLEIHFDEPQIIVNARGTRLTITYQVSSDGQSLLENPFWTGDDRSAPVSLKEFRTSAWLAAQKTAQEIGRIVTDSKSADDRPKNEAADSAKLVSLVPRIGAGRPLPPNSAQAASRSDHRRIEAIENATVSVVPGQCSGNKFMIECAAQALFEHVFAGSQRLDMKHLWLNCDEATKEGFRGEAEAALKAVLSVWLQDAASEHTIERPVKFA